MQVRVGSELIAVSGAPNQTLNFPNGSSLILNQKSPQDVTWEVSRGDFLIRVGGEAGLAVHSWSRQKANVTWSAANRSVDLQNLSSGPMIASLPNRTDASVSPGAVLQFVRLSEFASAASAAVGDVTLYDRATGKRSNLSRGQSVLKSAQDATDTLGVPPTPVTLAWRSSGGLEITKDGVRTVLHPNEETILIGSDGSELRVRFTGERGAELVTIARAALIKTEKMDGLSLYLPPNTSFSLSARANSGFIEGRAGAGNTVPVRLTGQDGSTMLLDADADVLVLAPLFGLTGAGVEAVYSEALEAAGRSNEKNVPGPRHVTPDSFARDPRGIYRPRITQPPVSVHGHHPR
jgi:hypothetical protein